MHHTVSNMQFASKEQIVSEPDDGYSLQLISMVGSKQGERTEWNGKDGQTMILGGWRKGEVDKEQWGRKCDAHSGAELTMSLAKWPISPWRGSWHWLLVLPLAVLGTGCIFHRNKKKTFSSGPVHEQTQSENKAAVCFNVATQNILDIWYTECWRPNKQTEASSSW